VNGRSTFANLAWSCGQRQLHTILLEVGGSTALIVWSLFMFLGQDLRSLELPKHVMRNVSRFRLRAHTLAVEHSIWRGGNGDCDKLLCCCSQWGACSFPLSRLVCVLSRNEIPYFRVTRVTRVTVTWSSSSLSANPYLWRPLWFYMSCLARLSLILFLNGTTNYAALLPCLP